MKLREVGKAQRACAELNFLSRLFLFIKAVKAQSFQRIFDATGKTQNLKTKFLKILHNLPYHHLFLPNDSKAFFPQQ